MNRPLSALLGTFGLASLLAGCATASEAAAKPDAPASSEAPAAAAQPLAGGAPDGGDVRTTTAGGSASCSAR